MLRVRLALPKTPRVNTRLPVRLTVVPPPEPATMEAVLPPDMVRVPGIVQPVPASVVVVEPPVAKVTF